MKIAVYVEDIFAGSFQLIMLLPPSKGRLRMTIFKSAETAHLILVCYIADAIRCTVSADLKMAAGNRSLPPSLQFLVHRK